MKNVRFNIKKLGAIENSKIDLNALMVFSGESGLGKSYAAFLVHYLYVLLTGDRIFRFFEKYDLNTLIKGKKAKDVILRLPSSELYSWINKDAISYIGYLLGNSDFTGEVEIIFPLKTKEFIFSFDEEIEGLSNNEKVYYKLKLLGLGLTYRIPTNSDSLNFKPLAALVGGALRFAIFESVHFLERTFLMPPSRGSLVELNERPAFLSGMYDEFFENKLTIDRPLKEPFEVSDTILDCLKKINVGEINRIEGKVIYRTAGEKTVNIPVTAAASSVKELAPITLFLKKYPAAGTSVLLEEPEAHLHPIRQVKVADLVGCAVQEGCHMQITTHSDYFIRRLNNLMMLYLLRKKDVAAFEKFSEEWNVSEKYLINPANVSAYLFQKTKNGTTEIVKQDISEGGVPFDSFLSVIEEDILSSRELRKLLE